MSKTVLIVDESMVSRMMVRETIMEQYSSWEFIQAASTDKAIEACRSEQFDFIIVDMGLSEKFNLKSVKSMAASQKRAKIALLANDVSLSFQSQAEQLMLTIIAKPINADELLRFCKQ